MFYYLSSLMFGLSPFLFSLLLSFLRALAHACRLGTSKLFSWSVAILCLLPVALSLGPVVQVYSAQVALQWDANPDSTVAGYKIYYGSASHNYASHIDVGKTTTYTVSNLQDGVTYYFATTDYNNSGTESDFSNEVVLNGAANCTYSLSSTAQSFGSSAGAGSVSVNVGAGCAWVAVSNVTWITITSNSSVTGGGTINYSVAANSSSSSRSGTITVAQQTFTVTQSGAPPYYTLSATKSGTGT
ncbi:MAG TPA: fibronectin type III domain-containing protein, partial [Thermodesulfobacteriota bacterium]|nr:fibronectin type III domain-containing protein [Thermodesulfobacteriota bacterium]